MLLQLCRKIGLFRKKATVTRSRSRWQRSGALLRLEILEERNCPSLTAPDLSGSVLHDHTLGETSVVGDCYDSNGLTISLVSNTNAAHGTVTMAADGSYQYQPNSGYVGPDVFTYTVTNGSDYATGNVNLTVTDNAPVAGGPINVQTVHDHTL